MNSDPLLDGIAARPSQPALVWYVSYGSNIELDELSLEVCHRPHDLFRAP